MAENKKETFDMPHASDCTFWVNEACVCITANPNVAGPIIINSKCNLCGTEWQTSEPVNDCPRNGCIEIRPLVLTQLRPSNFPLYSLHSAMLAAFDLGFFCGKSE